MKNFLAFITESYFAILLIEGKGQHQIIKQFGAKIAERLAKEYEQEGFNDQNDSQKIKHLDLNGNVIEEIEGKNKNADAPIIEKLHPKFYEQQLRDSIGGDPEKAYKMIADIMGIPEKPEHMDLSDPKEAAAWDQHVNWMLSRYATGGHTVDPAGNVKKMGIGHTSDIPDVLENLKHYHEFVKQGEIDPQALGKWKNAEDLDKSIKKKQNTWDEWVRKGEAEHVAENEHWHIVRPHTERAACALGSSTSWCTTASHFDHYNTMGPLYIAIPKKPGKLEIEKGHLSSTAGTSVPEKYQFHFEDPQFRRPDQQPMSEEEVKRVLERPFPGIIDKIAKIAMLRDYPSGNTFRDIMNKKRIDIPVLTDDDYKQMMHQGHITHVLRNHPNIVKDEDIFKLLDDKTQTVGVKESLLQYIFKNQGIAGRKNNNGFDFLTKEMYDDMIEHGYGAALLTHQNIKHNARRETSNPASKLVPEWFNPAGDVQRMFDAYAKQDNPRLQHRKTMDYIMQNNIDILLNQEDDKGEDVISPDPEIAKNNIQKLLGDKNPSEHKVRVINSFIKKLPNSEFGRGVMSDLVPHIIDAPHVHVNNKIDAIQAGHRTIQNYGYNNPFTIEHVEKTLKQFLNTNYPKIRRVQPDGTPYVEDTASTPAKKLIQSLMDYTKDNKEKFKEYIKPIMFGPHGSLISHLSDHYFGDYPEFTGDEFLKVAKTIKDTPESHDTIKKIMESSHHNLTQKHISDLMKMGNNVMLGVVKGYKAPESPTWSSAYYAASPEQRDAINERHQERLNTRRQILEHAFEHGNDEVREHLVLQKDIPDKVINEVLYNPAHAGRLRGILFDSEHLKVPESHTKTLVADLENITQKDGRWVSADTYNDEHNSKLYPASTYVTAVIKRQPEHFKQNPHLVESLVDMAANLALPYGPYTSDANNVIKNLSNQRLLEQHHYGRLLNRQPLTHMNNFIQTQPGLANFLTKYVKPNIDSGNVEKLNELLTNDVMKKIQDKYQYGESYTVTGRMFDHGAFGKYHIPKDLFDSAQKHYETELAKPENNEANNKFSEFHRVPLKKAIDLRNKLATLYISRGTKGEGEQDPDEIKQINRNALGHVIDTLHKDKELISKYKALSDISPSEPTGMTSLYKLYGLINDRADELTPEHKQKLLDLHVSHINDMIKNDGALIYANDPAADNPKANNARRAIQVHADHISRLAPHLNANQSFDTISKFAEHYDPQAKIPAQRSLTNAINNHLHSHLLDFKDEHLDQLFKLNNPDLNSYILRHNSYQSLSGLDGRERSGHLKAYVDSYGKLKDKLNNDAKYSSTPEYSDQSVKDTLNGLNSSFIKSVDLSNPKHMDLIENEGTGDLLHEALSANVDRRSRKIEGARLKKYISDDNLLPNHKILAYHDLAKRVLAQQENPSIFDGIDHKDIITDALDNWNALSIQEKNSAGMALKYMPKDQWDPEFTKKTALHKDQGIRLHAMETAPVEHLTDSLLDSHNMSYPKDAGIGRIGQARRDEFIGQNP